MTLWLADLAFLVDLIGHLNTLNKSLQGKDQLVPQLNAHMKAFRAKLCLFETQLRNFNVAHFPTLSEIKCGFPNAHLSAKKEKYVSVLTSLKTEFSQRFQDFSTIEKKIKLFSTPFVMDAEEVEESLQLELIEMQCDDSLKNQHQLLSLPDFYQSLEKDKFPLMRHNAKRMMSLFGSTYICEQTFSLLTLNKSRLRTKMTTATSVMSFTSQPPNSLLTCQTSFSPKRSITAPTKCNSVPIKGDLKYIIQYSCVHKLNYLITSDNLSF